MEKIMAFRIKIKNGYYNLYIYIILSSMNFIVSMEKPLEENNAYRTIKYLKEDLPFDYDVASYLMIPYSLLNKSVIESLKDTPKFTQSKLRYNKNKYYNKEYRSDKKKSLLINVYNITYGKKDDESRRVDYILPQTEYTLPKTEYILPQTEYILPQTEYILPQTEETTTQKKLFFTIADDDLSQRWQEYTTQKEKEHNRECSTEIGSFVLKYKAPSTLQPGIAWTKTDDMNEMLAQGRKFICTHPSKSEKKISIQRNFRLLYGPFKSNIFQKNLKKYMDSAKDSQRWAIIEKMPIVKLNYTKNK